MVASLDAPDWQRVVTSVTSTGAVPDAPDWERIVVGPSGTPVAPLPSSIVTDWPPDFGWNGWSLPLWTCNDSISTLLNGKVNLGFCKATTSGSIGHLYFVTTGLWGARVANECYMGLYTPNFTAGIVTSFTLVSSSAAGVLEGLVATQGLIKCPISPAVNVTAGNIYYVGLLVNLSSGSAPQAWYSGNVVVPAGFTYQYTITAGTTSTTLPPTMNVAGATLGADYLFFAMGA